jgi:hypothetical protein
MLDLDIEVTKTQMMAPAHLKELYKNQDVSEHRFNVVALTQEAQKIMKNPSIAVTYKLNPELSKNLKNIGSILFPENPNTAYEELRCVGSANYNYDLDMLVATLTIKKPSGYNGPLCSAGSYEYVAFWAYAWDQIEQMCAWKYLGMSSVNVHDISTIPKEGLQYAVYLPYDFSNLRDKCNKPVVILIRAILSWQIPPPDYTPSYQPTYGNSVDALIQLRPIGKPIGNDQVPYISVVGRMAVASISGNADSTYSTILGKGYAEGPCVGGGFTADDSPFGGTIEICGHISNPPDDPLDANKLRYKVQYRKDTTSIWKDITNDFWIWISKWTWDTILNIGYWTQSPHKQVATNGYYDYEEDLTAPVQRFVEGNTLAEWITPVSEGNGLYEVRVLLKKIGAPAAPDVPADHVVSNIIKVMIDNTAPNAEVYLDVDVTNESCHEFIKDETLYTTGITGKFTATDYHFGGYSLWIEPNITNAPTISPTSESYPGLPSPGTTDKAFTITVNENTAHCGYVVHLIVWDRTIVNNHGSGNRAGATLGFCLLESNFSLKPKPQK